LAVSTPHRTLFGSSTGFDRFNVCAVSNNRSESIRHALRDAVRHPELTRASREEIAGVEHARRTGESETFTREDIVGDDE